MPNGTKGQKPKAAGGDSDSLFRDNYREFQKRRARFEDIDNDINESAARLMKSMADVAEKNPDEFFGLKASEREIFVLNKVLDPVVLAALGTGDTTNLEGDIIGSQDADSGKKGFFEGLLGDVFKKFDIPGMILELIKDQKKYWFGQSEEDGKKAENEGTRVRQPGQ